MKLKETLLWIIDIKNKSFEEAVRIKIDFVHSLGLKCDCVGWSKLDLGDPNADKILSAISEFCKENGCTVRGCYERLYADFESDWYELTPTTFTDDTGCGSDEYITADGESIKVLIIRAYKEKKIAPKWFYDYVFVPDRFREACIRHSVADVAFCWARDKGRFDAEQYFELYGNMQISEIANACFDTDRDHDRNRIQLLGGYLPKLDEIFSKLSVAMPCCYRESDMPNCNIANAFYPSNFWRGGRNKFLLHKEFVELLLKDKAITENDIRPALVFKDFLPGYKGVKTEMQPRPTDSDLRSSILAYEKLKKQARPTQNISEKEALKALRERKRDRKEDFSKALSKSLMPRVEETKYLPVLPYYLIANGGYLSDEYKLLSFDEAIKEDTLFAKELLAEEILKDTISGVVFAKCPDGDRVLLAGSGKVIRYSHESVDAIQEWISLAQFVVDAINTE